MQHGYKATNQDLTCNRYPFQIGVKEVHQGKVKLCESGFHFCINLEDCLRYYNPTDRFFKVVAEEVSAHEHYDTKRVARYMTLVEEVKLPWEDEEFQLKAVRINGYYISRIKNPSMEVKMAAVTKSGGAIHYIKSPTEALKMAAVRSDGYAIEHMNHPSAKLQRVALKNSMYAYRYIKEKDRSKETLQYIADLRNFKI